MSSDVRLALDVHAASDPDRVAAVEFGSGRAITFAQLEDRSRRLAGLWRARGLRPGDHVAVLLDNCTTYFEVSWAAQRSGLYLTPVNWHLGPEEAGYIVADCQARSVVSTARFAPVLEQLGDVLDGVHTRLVLDGDVDGLERYADAIDAAEPIDAGDEREGMWMFYSSGTTGRPKGIKPELRDAPYGTPGPIDLMVTTLYGFREGITYLSPAPLYHAAPLAWSMATQRLGGTVVVLEHFDAEAVLRAIEQHRISHAQFVPTHFVRMLKLDEATRADADLSSLELVVHAAAPCPPEVKERILDWFGPIVHEYYSASEGAGFCTIGPDEWRAHRGSVGRSLLGPVHVLGADGEEVPVGETGQLWFEGAYRFEYHGDPVKTSEVLDDRGWATMGDIGYVDDEGYVYLTDRVSHTVISGGVNIYPREIEDVLVVHPDVMDAAVIGVPDEEMGERLLAVVQPVPGTQADGALADALQTHCRAHLAGYKCPREITFVDELPRLPTGKIRKSELRAQHGTWSGRTDAVADR